MESEEEVDPEIEKIMRISAIIAMIIGVFVAAYLIWLDMQKSYSELYLYPSSYSNYINASELPKEISFVYGIKSHEKKDKIYSIKFYLNGVLVKSKRVKIARGETFEEKEHILIPKNVTFPAKVEIVAEVDHTIYEVHFWLKKESY